MMYDIRL